MKKIHFFRLLELTLQICIKVLVRPSIWGDSNEKLQWSVNNMHSSSSSDYDQNQFFDDNDANGHGLDDDGFIFIPSRSEIIWPVYNDIWTHCIFKSYIIVVKMGQLNVISMSIFMAVLWWVKSKDHQTLLVSNTKMCQERSWLGDGYVQRLGFLGLAEENNIVMMFPQVSFVHHKGARNDSLFDQKYISLDSPLSCARESKWMLVGEISKKV